MVITGLPMPPSANALYRNVNRRFGKGSGRVKTNEYKIFESKIKQWAWQNPDQFTLARTFIKQVQSRGDLIRLDLTFFFERSRIITKDQRPKRLDTSNRLKAMHDALANMLGFDDCLIWSGAFDKIALHTGGEYAEAKLAIIKKNHAFTPTPNV